MRTKRNRAATGGRTRSRRGGVLAFVVMAVLAVATLSAGMLQVSSAMTKRQVSNTNMKLAFYMAETGLAESYQGLSIGKTGNVGSPAAPAALGNGLFWVEATENLDGTVTLDSTGMLGNGRAELSLVVERRLTSVASLGVFADGGINIGPGMSLDGYDSGASAYEQEVQHQLIQSLGSGIGEATGGLIGGTGPIGGTLLGTTEALLTQPSVDLPMGRLGSNSSINVVGDVNAPTVIDGNLIPGPGEAVVTTGDVTINGTSAPAKHATTLPAITAPTFTPSSSINHSGLIPHLILPGQHQMPLLQTNSGAEVVIQGPATVVLDELRVLQGSTLSFDTTGGAVHLYVKDLLDFEQGSAVNTSSQKAWEVTIQVPGTMLDTATLAATSQFYGLIYGPQAVFQIESPFEYFGSIVADELNFVGPVQMHYDEHLEEIAEELALPRLVSWRIVQLSNPLDLSKVMDPFTLLGLDRDTCPGPAASHEDQNLEVFYVPAGGGAETSYVGPESGFDWSLVDDVSSIIRDGVKIDPDGGGLAELGSALNLGG